MEADADLGSFFLAEHEEKERVAHHVQHLTHTMHEAAESSTKD